MPKWILLFMIGILAVILGGIAVVYPEATAVGVEIFVSWSLIVLGIATVIMAFAGRDVGSIFWPILLGVLMVVSGWILWKNPTAGVAALSMVLAILSIAQGCVMLVAAFDRNIGGYRWWLVLGAVSSFVLAWLIFRAPVASLGILFGVQLIINGFSVIGLSFSVRDAAKLFR